MSSATRLLLRERVVEDRTTGDILGTGHPRLGACTDVVASTDGHEVEVVGGLLLRSGSSARLSRSPSPRTYG